MARSSVPISSRFALMEISIMKITWIRDEIYERFKESCALDDIQISDKKIILCIISSD